MGNPISFPWNYLQFQKKFLFHMQMKRASLKYLGGEKKKGRREDCAHLSVLVSLVVGELI